jgi:hypothetical protein
MPNAQEVRCVSIRRKLRRLGLRQSRHSVRGVCRGEMICGIRVTLPRFRQALQIMSFEKRPRKL